MHTLMRDVSLSGGTSGRYYTHDDMFRRQGNNSAEEPMDEETSEERCHMEHVQLVSRQHQTHTQAGY